MLYGIGLGVRYQRNGDSRMHTQMDRTTYTFKEIVGFVSGGVKILAVSVVALYGLGFIVVNSYLHQYGIASFELLKARYLAAGLNWLFLTSLLILSLVAAGVVATRVFRRYQKRFQRRPGQIEGVVGRIRDDELRDILSKVLLFLIRDLPAGVMSLLVFALICVLLLMGFEVMFILLFRVYRFFVFDPFLIIVAGGLGASLILFEVIRKERQRWSMFHAYSMAYLIPVTVGLWLGSVVYFGAHIYPTWPAKLGGGQPVRAELILSKHGQQSPGVLPVDTLRSRGTFAVTRELRIIDQTARTYVLLISNSERDSVVEIRKDLVDQVVYHRSREQRFRRWVKSQELPPSGQGIDSALTADSLKR